MQNTIVENHLNSDYIPYSPISKKGDETTYVNKDIFYAQQEAKKNIPKDIFDNWDNWVSKLLTVTQEELFSSFSSEQIDSIGIGLLNFQRNIPFLVADETGVGKGRILAGLTHYALKNGKKVIFFTEREHLHSEFWRDLEDTNTASLLKNPSLYHTTATIFNQMGEVVLKGKQKTILDIETSGFPSDCNFIFTNYSQVSLKNHKKTKKNALVNFIEDDCLIILDECHNATGDSNTKEFLKDLFDKTQQHKPKIIFSSATFIKDESQLDLYNELLSFEPEILDLLKKLLSHKEFDTSLLRKNMTLELTKKLRLWRREHEPINVTWNNIECENKEFINDAVNCYSEFILTLFDINSQIAKFVEEHPQGNTAIPPADKISKNWFNLGSTVNRYTKNLIFILKAEETANQIEKSLKRNHKPVIVIDSTLSSLLKETEEYNKNHEHIEENKVFTFSQALKALAFKTVGNIVSILQQGESTSELKSIILNYQNLLRITEGIMTKLILSPIDHVSKLLKERNISIGEISGRLFYLNIEKNTLDKKPKIPKFKIVAGFNNGDIDAIIITRAGASGISLHASRLFKNQNIRDLFEIDITTRPSYRVQFLGRVNRKNQSNKPEYYAITTHLPFEQRILNKENIKLTTIQTHISGQKEKFKQTHILNLYTHYINKNTISLLQNNKHLAKQCGIFINTDSNDNDDPYYYVDSILKRSIILPVDVQEKIFDYLKYCTEAESLLNSNMYSPVAYKINNVLPFQNHLKPAQAAKFKETFKNNPYSSFNQYDFKYTSLLILKNGYQLQQNNIIELKKELQENKTNNIELDCQSIIATIRKDNKYNYEYIRNHITPLLEKLKIGTQIKITPDNTSINDFIMGYINNIYHTPQTFNFENIDATIFEVVTVNPLLSELIHSPHQKIYISLKDILENSHIKTSNFPINWSQFERKEGKYIREQLAITGQPVLVEFFNQAYNIGQVHELKHNNDTFMTLILPAQFNLKNIQALPKPLVSVYDTIQAFYKNYNYLSSIWQDEKDMKAGLTLEKNILNGTVFYKLRIANEIKDSFVDFPLHKELKPFQKSNQQGFAEYLILDKKIFKILYMLEKRQVIWFGKNK